MGFMFTSLIIKYDGSLLYTKHADEEPHADTNVPLITSVGTANAPVDVVVAVACITTGLFAL